MDIKVSELLSIPKTSHSDARILLGYMLKKSGEFLIAHPDFAVDEAASRDFFSLAAKRERGVPLAYLTNHREFFGLDFYVDERVLIPRPETELLVESVIDIVRGETLPNGADGQVTILDVGTGSGCIAISLAKNLPRANIIAVDISQGAIEVAQKNAVTHEVSSRILFLKSDLLENAPEKSIDIIVANLPYIGTSEHDLVSREVKDHEPNEALFAGPDGFDLFERLFEQIAPSKFPAARSRLSLPPSFIALEIGFSQKNAIAKLITKYFGNVEVLWKNDLAGLNRIAIICWKN